MKRPGSRDHAGRARGSSLIAEVDERRPAPLGSNLPFLRDPHGRRSSAGSRPATAKSRARWRVSLGRESGLARHSSVEGTLARAKPSSLTRRWRERVWCVAAAVRGFGLGPHACGVRQRVSEVTSQIRLAAENAAVGGCRPEGCRSQYPPGPNGARHFANIVSHGFGFGERDREMAACGRAEASGSPSSEPLSEI